MQQWALDVVYSSKLLDISEYLALEASIKL